MYSPAIHASFSGSKLADESLTRSRPKFAIIVSSGITSVLSSSDQPRPAVEVVDDRRRRVAHLPVEGDGGRVQVVAGVDLRVGPADEPKLVSRISGVTNFFMFVRLLSFFVRVRLVDEGNMRRTSACGASRAS